MIFAKTTQRLSSFQTVHVFPVKKKIITLEKDSLIATVKNSIVKGK